MFSLFVVSHGPGLKRKAGSTLMTLWRLQRKNLTSNYDYIIFIVRARTQETARKLAAEEAKDKNCTSWKDWLTEIESTCEAFPEYGERILLGRC